MDRTTFPDESTEFRSHALACLMTHCRAEKPRLQRTAEIYVMRAVAAYDAAVAGDAESRRERIKALIRELVDSDDEKIAEIIETNDWAQTTRVVLAYAANKYGRPEMYGKQLTDYFQDAVTQLLERSRHLPVHRGVEVNAFLCEVIRSLIDHERQKTARPPAHLRIIGGRKANAEAGEFSEHLLPPSSH